MSKFDILTKYIPLIQVDSIGECVVDKKSDGTPENPIKMPFVEYSKLVHNFVEDFYAFENSNKDMNLTHYVDILKNNGVEWNSKSIEHTDVSNLSAQCVLSLIMHAIRSERFCEGTLLDCFKRGYILKWLKILNSIE
jgi:hypothetical protein